MNQLLTLLPQHLSPRFIFRGSFALSACGVCQRVTAPETGEDYLGATA